MSLTKQDIKSKVNNFLKDHKQKKIELDVPKNFSIYWIRNPFAVWFRKFCLLIFSKVPPMKVKTAFFKFMGYNFGRDVCLPGYIFIDTYFPELITIKEGVLVGAFVSIIPWQIKDGKLTLGRIYVARRVLLSMLTHILPGAVIHEKVITGIKSYIDTEIPKNSFLIKRNQVIKTWTKEEIEKYFGESMHNLDYASYVSSLTKKFRKDKNLREIRFRNNGNRLNAGNDWWRARQVWRIYYNGICVELSLLCPFESIRKLLYWFMGCRWGKNFRLGKRVMYDHIYGDMVQIGDNVTVEEGCILDGHEYTIAETFYARTIIKNNVLIKKNSWIRAGVTIGNNAVIEENSDIMKDVGDYEIWEGTPAKLVGKN